jgi:glycosyltransferase involved in cell wall biosynthesis
MIAAPKDPIRALLRRARAGWRLAGAALDYRRECGLGGIAERIANRSNRPRSISLLAGKKTPLRGAVFDVIYAIGYWDGEPKRYRVFNFAEGLHEAGYSVHVMPFERIADIVDYQWRATALVLFRAEYDRLVGVEETLAYARNNGIRVIYDIDDLVFDPAIAGRIDGLQSMGSYQRRAFVSAITRRHRLMLACDQVTASTAPLARAAAGLGLPSVVVPNSLNNEQLRLAAELVGRKPIADQPLRIGYFSGTRTHQRDFAVCEAALLEIMRRHEEAVFRVVGFLDLGSRWNPFAERVEHIGFVEPADLLRLIAQTDINLAPLELGNPFCEAKSELKFFEAAVVGLPTIASATEPFTAAIEQDVSGFVVHNSDGWGDALSALVTSATRRKAMGEAARKRALAWFSPAAVLPQAIAALGLAAPKADVGAPSQPVHVLG